MAKLHAKGLAKIAQKLGEEATEAVIAALAGDEAELVGEAADVIFHLMVLLAEKGVKLEQVLAEASTRGLAQAEAMALGLREGVDADALYEVITHSAGNSWMFENRMAHVLAGDYTPLSAVDIFVKDLGLVLDMARASKFPLPLSSTAHQMFMQETI